MNDQVNVSDKVEIIASSVEKNNVRADLVSQVTQYIEYMIDINDRGQNDFTVASLPASKWAFERLLANAVKNCHAFEGMDVSLKLFGAETNPQVFLHAIRNAPQDSYIGRMDFNDMIQKPLVEKSGILFVDQHNMPNQFSVRPDIVWADYCGAMSIHAIGEKRFKPLEETALQIKSLGNRPSLYYVTFQAKPRQIAGGTKKLLQHMRYMTNADNLADGVADAIRYFLKKHGVKNVHKVMQVVYGGGRIESTNMLTIGFAVNLPKDIIMPIMENRIVARQKTKLRQWQIAHKVQLGEITCPVPRNVRTHGECRFADLSPCRERRARAIVRDRIHKGATNNAILIELHENGYKVTKRSLGSVMAWECNPDSFPTHK